MNKRREYIAKHNAAAEELALVMALEVVSGYLAANPTKTLLIAADRRVYIADREEKDAKRT